MALANRLLNGRIKDHEKDWSHCQRCPLGATTTKHVLYRGSIPCQILFIGEAPGTSEDVTGKPFVGPSGDLLNLLIFDSSNRLNRDYTYAITNIIACAPWLHRAEGTVRPPSHSEAEACRPRLIEFIQLALPKAIVLLGKSAMGFVPKTAAAIPKLSLVHPSYILRSEKQDLEYRRSLLYLVEFLAKVL